MSLPPRIPKKAKRASRWRSQAHCNFVRSHACCNCHGTAAIEVAHVRIGSGAGVGQKPDDFRGVSLCQECHSAQHTFGERTFWASYEKTHGKTVETLIAAFCKASPKAREIERVKRERSGGA